MSEPPPMRPAPDYTSKSIGMITYKALSAFDFIFEIGAVIIHPATMQFLLFVNMAGRYCLPDHPIENGFVSSTKAPLAFAAQETGYTISRLPLRKVTRGFEFKAPPSRNPSAERPEPIAVYLDTLTTDAFHVSIDRTWIAEEGSSSAWPQPRQLITFWYAGRIDDERPPRVAPREPDDSATRQGHLLSADDAFRELLDGGAATATDFEAFGAFLELWNKTNPNDPIR